MSTHYVSLYAQVCIWRYPVHTTGVFMYTKMQYGNLCRQENKIHSIEEIVKAFSTSFAYSHYFLTSVLRCDLMVETRRDSKGRATNGIVHWQIWWDQIVGLDLVCYHTDMFQAQEKFSCCYCFFNKRPCGPFS